MSVPTGLPVLYQLRIDPAFEIVSVGLPSDTVKVRIELRSDVEDAQFAYSEEALTGSGQQPVRTLRHDEILTLDNLKLSGNSQLYFTAAAVADIEVEVYLRA